MMFIVFSLSFAVFISSYVIRSLSNGITSTVDSINADIIVVPGEYEGKVKDSLFKGEPVTVFFEKNWTEQLQLVEGVKSVSPQLYLATLSASCCDASVQLIAFDPSTDFVVQPWINQNGTSNLGGFEAVIGNDLKYEVGDTAKFYGQQFKIVGKLDRTGMGYDQSAFISMQTAFELSYTDIAKQYFNFSTKDSAISSILIKVNDGVSVQETAGNIRKMLKGEDILVYSTDDLVGDTKETIANFGVFFHFFTAILILISVITLISIFFITINERQHEFGILASIGAKKKQLAFIISGEAFLISIIGSITGVAFAKIVLYVLTGYIKVTLQLPFLEPTSAEQIVIFIKCILVAILSGGLASIVAAYRINCIQPYLLIKENE